MSSKFEDYIPEKRPKAEEPMPQPPQPQPPLPQRPGVSGWDVVGQHTGVLQAKGAMTPRQHADVGNATPFQGGLGFATASLSFQNFTGTPLVGMGSNQGFAGAQTPLAGGAMSTPAVGGASGVGFQTPNIAFSGIGSIGGLAGDTPLQSRFVEAAAAQSLSTQRITQRAEELARDWERRNRYLTDEELDEMLPPSGYAVAAVPSSYQPTTNHEKPAFYDIAAKLIQMEVEEEQRLQALAAAGINVGGADGAGGQKKYDIPESLGDGLPQMTPQDAPVFEILLQFANEADESVPEPHRNELSVMRALFKIKNGDGVQRRAGMAVLTNRDRVHRIFGPALVFDKLLAVWRSRTLTGDQLHRFARLLKSLMLICGNALLVPHAKDIINAAQPLLFDSNKHTREDGKDVVSTVARIAGIGAVLKAVAVDTDSDDRAVRATVARVLAVASRATDPERVMKFVEKLATDARLSTNAKHTAVRVISELADLYGSTILRHLQEVTCIAQALLQNERLEVRTEAANAISSVAEACAPYGIECFIQNGIVPTLRSQMRQLKGKQLAAFLKAFGSIVPLMQPADAEVHTTHLLNDLVDKFRDYHDADLRRVVLGVIQNCVGCEGVTKRYIKDRLLAPFLDGFWGDGRVLPERRDLTALSEATIAVAKKLGGAEVVPRLLHQLRDVKEEGYHRMVCDTIKEIVTTCGTLDFSDQQMADMIDACQYAILVDEAGLNGSAVQSFAAVVNGFGARVATVAPLFCSEILGRFSHRVAQVRRQAADVVSLIAQTLIECNNMRIITEFWHPFFASLDAETEPGPIAATLKAIRALITAICSSNSTIRLDAMSDPTVNDLHDTVANLVATNREREVRLRSIELVGEIVRWEQRRIESREPGRLDALRLQELATRHLFPLLAEENRATRRVTAEVYGDIASVIMPYKVVTRLLDNMSSDKRNTRICTGVALAVIARKSGPYTVLPFLINEYEACEKTQSTEVTQHAILKCVRFMFEFLGPDGKDYAYGLIPLLQRAMTDRCSQHRRMAIEASIAIVMAVVNTDGNFEDLVIHLLNFVHPNIVEMLSGESKTEKEERNKLVTAVVQFFEAAALVVGAAVIFQYLVQGLYHPAEKVRDIYWRTYNMIYVQNPEALIPSHPILSPWDTAAEEKELRQAFVAAGPQADLEELEMQLEALRAMQPRGAVPELQLLL